MSQVGETSACVVHEPRDAPRCCIIWLHGLGADGHDFAPLADALDLPHELGARFVFPHAPVRPVTVNNGYRMRAWYDIVASDLTAQTDHAGLDASAAMLAQWLRDQARDGIAAARVVVGGFSQGGAVALHGGLRYSDRLAGILALSTYLPMPERLPDAAAPANRDTPVLMTHGTEDPVIPFAHGQRSARWLEQAGYPVDFYRDAGTAHTVSPQALGVVRRWLLDMLGAALLPPGR